MPKEQSIGLRSESVMLHNSEVSLLHDRLKIYLPIFTQLIKVNGHLIMNDLLCLNALI
jgi:hypothetical protein